MGFSAYGVIPPFRDPYRARMLNRVPNQELTLYSEATSQARTLAMQRLEGDLQALGAEGVVDVKTDLHTAMHQHESSIMLRVDFFVLGTAVARGRVVPPAERPSPILNITGLHPVRTTRGVAQRTARKHDER